MIKFSKFCSENFTSRHRSTLLCAKFVKTVRRKIGEIVRYLGDQKNKISAHSQTVAAAQIALKVCLGQPPTFGSQHSKLHPYRFTFGGVIARRVKAVKTRLKVFPILGKAIASHTSTKIQTNFKISNFYSFNEQTFTFRLQQYREFREIDDVK